MRPQGLREQEGKEEPCPVPLSRCQQHAMGRDVQDRVRSTAQPAGTGPSLDLGLSAPSSRFVPRSADVSFNSPASECLLTAREAIYN